MSDPAHPHIEDFLTLFLSKCYIEPIIVQDNKHNESTATTGLPMLISNNTLPYNGSPVSNVETTDGGFFGNTISSHCPIEPLMMTPDLTSHSSEELNSQCQITYAKSRSSFSYVPSYTASPQHDYVSQNLLTKKRSSENICYDHPVKLKLMEPKMKQPSHEVSNFPSATFKSPALHAYESPSSSQNWRGHTFEEINRTISLSDERHIEKSVKDHKTLLHQHLSQQLAYDNTTQGGSVGILMEVACSGKSLKSEIMPSYTQNTHVVQSIQNFVKSVECEQKQQWDSQRFNNQMLVCDACPQLHFRSTTHFYRHCVQEHPIKESKIQCGKCPRKFRSPKNFRDHLRDFHCDADVFKCPECPAGFSCKKDFILHYRRTHLRLPPIQCESCGGEFTNHSDLYKHEYKCLHSKKNPSQLNVSE